MDTIGIETPRDARRAGWRGTAALVLAAAVAALAGGYAIGTSTDAPAQPAQVIARGTPATWDDAVAEANALKRHRAAERGRIDVRMARVED